MDVAPRDAYIPRPAVLNTPHVAKVRVEMQDMHPQILGMLSSRSPHGVPASPPCHGRCKPRRRCKDSTSPSPAKPRRQVLFVLRAGRRCTERRAGVGGWMGSEQELLVARLLLDVDVDIRRSAKKGSVPGRRQIARAWLGLLVLVFPHGRTSLSQSFRGLAGVGGGQEVLGIRLFLDVEVDEDMELGILLLLVLVRMYPTPIGNRGCGWKSARYIGVARVGVGVEHLNVMVENLLLPHLLKLPVLPALGISLLVLRRIALLLDAPPPSPYSFAPTRQTHSGARPHATQCRWRTTTASAPAPPSSLNPAPPNYAPQNNNSLRDALGRITAIAGAVAGFCSTSVRCLFGAPPTDPEWIRMNELP
ncbi:hypothetical protein C8J57DRAFT_1515416 [Mycena rebaudengoi]|nr:hypothetical protein C8J57DRAFT_1515416 [Mycena rebaudengoi]